MRIGYIGLGKMGRNHVQRLTEKGHEVVVWNRSKEVYSDITSERVDIIDELSQFHDQLSSPRVIWIMVTHTAVDDVFEELRGHLDSGDILIDGGNSYFKDTLRRAATAEGDGIHYLDAGVSGGPEGARSGSCIMMGGENKSVTFIKDIIESSVAPGAFQHMGAVGSGHFTKMVHNGIEYGMMQALAEGFNILKHSDFNISVRDAASIYSKKSVIASRLVEWAYQGFETYGEDLNDVTGVIGHSGEGKWTVDTAHEMNQPVPIIEGAYTYRVESEHNPHYIGKVVSMLRTMFGGHSVDK